MTAFEQAIAFTLEAEGVLSNDSHDAGGLTKYGISQKAYPNVDIRKLTEDEAIAIYKRDYWNRVGADQLPSALALLVFDTAVNHGPGQAVRWLQSVLKVNADGVVGPVTLHATQHASWMDIATDLLSLRALNYAANPDFRYFGWGWMRRLFRLHSHFNEGFRP